MSWPIDELPVDPHEDDSAAMQTLAHERYTAIVDAIYEAAMRGLPEPMCRLLCSETGVRWTDVQRYQPPYFIPKENSPSLELPF